MAKRKQGVGLDADDQADQQEADQQAADQQSDASDQPEESRQPAQQPDKPLRQNTKKCPRKRPDGTDCPGVLKAAGSPPYFTWYRCTECGWRCKVTRPGAAARLRKRRRGDDDLSIR